MRPAWGRARGRRVSPSWIIKSTFNDHLMSSRGSPRRCDRDRPRAEILQDDVRDGRSENLRATWGFLLGMHEVHGREGPRWTRRRSWLLSTRFLSEPRPTVHQVLRFLGSPRVRRTGQRAELITPTRGVREPLRLNAEGEHQHIVGEVDHGARVGPRQGRGVSQRRWTIHSACRDCPSWITAAHRRVVCLIE